ncbi:MAG: hypothetical protein LBC75_09725 [Fibromonadaceae bacterium]|jgi:uncharacterized protein (TIGR02145 family)|nr:hypothetical protein [Fibromonadaceae bacterium]
MRKQFLKFAQVAGIMLALTFTFGCSGSDDDTGGSGTAAGGAGGSCDISDYNKVVMPDGKTWMAENMNCVVAGSRCYGEGGREISYDKNGYHTTTLSNAEIKANCAKYGRLYDWEAAMKVCPNGWHLPSYDEWTTLINYVGGEDIAGKKLKTKDGWSYNLDGKIIYGKGTDDYGFSALPGGFGDSNGDFTSGSSGGWWWSATMSDDSNICYLSLDYKDDDAYKLCNTSLNSNKVLFYVRCVQG